MKGSPIVAAALLVRSVLAQTSCIEGDFNLEVRVDESESCDYNHLLEAYTIFFDANKPTSCNNSAADDLAIILGDPASAIDHVAEICKSAIENYGFVREFTEIAKKGGDFEQVYYNGGTTWNEEVQTEYPLDDEGKPSNRLRKQRSARGDADTVTRFYQGDAQYGMVEWPEHLTNFEPSTCTTNAAYCCWTTDRQANDNNGNCNTPYDVNCIDKDPADNTNLCYVDNEAGKLSTGYDAGYSIYPFDDNNGNTDDGEGPIHCHGFAWANKDTHPVDFSSTYKGNNLFYVSMYDHMSQRGYVRNIQGAPMCACSEQMPVVTRSDCTQIDVQETFEFSFSNSAFTVELVDIYIDFNACQGFDREGKNDNNDLWSYMNRLYREGKVSAEQLAALSEKLVGDQPDNCGMATKKFLYRKDGLVSPGYNHDQSTWVLAAGKGNLADGPKAFLPFFASSTNKIIQRVCATCKPSHQYIYYKRITDVPEDFDLLNSLLNSNIKNEANIFNEDFKLYSTYRDAQKDENAWDCNGRPYKYDKFFPGNCGPAGSAEINHQAASFNPPLFQGHVAFYAERSGADLAQVDVLDLGEGDGIAYEDLTGQTLYISTTQFDLWDTQDEFTFVHEAVDDNSEVLSLVVNLKNLNAESGLAKAGLMIRESLNNDSAYAAVFLTKNNGVVVSNRYETGDITYAFGERYGETLGSQWLKLEMRRSSVYATYSDDGVEWKSVGGKISLNRNGGTLFVGRAASSHSKKLTEAVFTDYGVSQFEELSSAPSISAAPTSSPIPSTSPTETPPPRFEQLNLFDIDLSTYYELTPPLNQSAFSEFYGVVTTLECAEGEGVSIVDCKAAGLAEGGTLRDGANIIIGSWSHTPPGCFINKGSDRAIHYSTNLNGNNDGGFLPVCMSQDVEHDYSLLPGERVGSRCPAGADLSIEDCKAQGVALGGNLNDGNVIVGGWQHTPSGCFIYPSSDNKIHYGTSLHGKNNGHSQPICDLGFPSNDFPTFPHCSEGKGVSIVDCKAAGLAEGGTLRDGANIIIGSWSHTPPGCFISKSDQAIHYSTNERGRNVGRFAPVCFSDESDIEFSYVKQPGASGSRCPAGADLSIEDCKAQGLALGGRLDKGNVLVGNWNHTPQGCFTDGGGTIHYGTNLYSRNNGNYDSICNLGAALPEEPINPGPEVFLYLSAPSSKCPPGAGVAVEDCRAAALAMGGVLRNGQMISGRWEHVPPGCFIGTGDKAVHFGYNENSANNGGFQPLCKAEHTSEYEIIPKAVRARCPKGKGVGIEECKIQGLALGGILRDGVNMLTGGWTHTGSGCFLTDDGAIHFGFKEENETFNHGQYRPICALSPTTSSPTTPAPTTSSPSTLAPTTSAPTTPSPTTSSPTTPVPTTSSPSTLAPTTSAPTIPSPTTSSPTTPAPTTSSPSTLAPTTSAPTTPSPTTSALTTSSNHMIVCGKTGGCGNLETRFASDTEEHEVRCCSSSAIAGWTKNSGCTVWAESEVGNDSKCYHNENFASAFDLCEAAGARLCTSGELEDNCTRGTGCGHDGDLIWSSTDDTPTTAPTASPISSSNHMIVCGRTGGCGNLESTSESDDEEHEVRCCSNNAFTGSSKRNGCTVWGGSKSGVDSSCHAEQNFASATELCVAAGARLCTKGELEDNCTQGTGCGYDVDLIWTSTTPS